MVHSGFMIRTLTASPLKADAGILEPPGLAKISRVSEADGFTVSWHCAVDLHVCSDLPLASAYSPRTASPQLTRPTAGPPCRLRLNEPMEDYSVGCERRARRVEAVGRGAGRRPRSRCARRSSPPDPSPAGCRVASAVVCVLLQRAQRSWEQSRRPARRGLRTLLSDRLRHRPARCRRRPGRPGQPRLHRSAHRPAPGPAHNSGPGARCRRGRLPAGPVRADRGSRPRSCARSSTRS